MSRHLVIGLALTALFMGATVTGRQIAPPPSPPPPPGARDANLARVQRIAIGTGTISGRVTTLDGGQPVRYARVMLNGTTGSAARGEATIISVPAAGTRRGDPPPASIGGNAGVAGMSVNRNSVTDEQGQFVIDQLPAGQFTLMVSHDLFLPTGYGQKAPGRPSTIVSLAEGQRFNAELQMARGGVITGTVYNENGERLVRAQVRVSRFQWVNGVRRPQANNGTSTDDRGVFRLFGLTPGDYVVSATAAQTDLMFADRAAAEAAQLREAITAARAANARTGGGAVAAVSVPLPPPGPDLQAGSAGFAPTYYPSATAVPQASILTVKAGEERENIDIRVLPIRASNITGTVTGIPGPGVRVQIALLSQGTEGESNQTSSQAGEDGRFVLRGVAPGQYLIFAQTLPVPVNVIVNSVPQQPRGPAGLQDAERLWARVPLTVDGQSTPSVNIVLQPGRSISGTVVFEMTRPVDPTRGAVTVSLVPAASAQAVPQFGPLPQAVVGPDGRFTLGGVFAGRYVFRTSPGSIRSALLNGEDTLDVPLDFGADQDITGVAITVSDRLSALTGTLSDPNGAATSEYSIVLAATESRFWTPGSRRIMMTRPNVNGRYSFGGIPPGDYLLAAVSDMEPGAQYDPEFLKTLAAAALRVSVTEGASTTQNIRVAR